SLRLADEGSATLRSRDGAVSLQLRKRPLHRALTQGGHAHEFQFGWKTVTSAPETPRDPFSDGCPETHVLRDSVRLATEELQKLLPDLVVLGPRRLRRSGLGRVRTSRWHGRSAGKYSRTI